MAAVVPGAGDKACSYGCMGLGSCVKACQFDAIHIVDGIAVVDKEKCVACGKCEFDAIHMDNNVAVIDYEKCTNCGKCAAKCPVKVIK